jgi:Flp pilus assembly protein TadG
MKTMPTSSSFLAQKLQARISSSHGFPIGKDRLPNGNGRRGQELVEFALVLPLLILIAFGVLDLGRAFHAFITITNAAREGARYVTLNRDDLGGAVGAAQAEAQSSGIAIPAGNVTPVCTLDAGGRCTSGQPVTVTVRFTFSPVMGGFLGANLPMVRSIQMVVP